MAEYGITKLKTVQLWINVELEMSNQNSKLVHAIFNVVSIDQMKVIANCEVAKDAT